MKTTFPNYFAKPYTIPQEFLTPQKTSSILGMISNQQFFLTHITQWLKPDLIQGIYNLPKINSIDFIKDIFGAKFQNWEGLPVLNEKAPPTVQRPTATLNNLIKHNKKCQKNEENNSQNYQKRERTNTQDSSLRFNPQDTWG